jgi:hypothetical protein
LGGIAFSKIHGQSLFLYTLFPLNCSCYNVYVVTLFFFFFIRAHNLTFSTDDSFDKAALNPSFTNSCWQGPLGCACLIDHQCAMSPKNVPLQPASESLLIGRLPKCYIVHVVTLFMLHCPCCHIFHVTLSMLLHCPCYIVHVVTLSMLHCPCCYIVHVKLSMLLHCPCCYIVHFILPMYCQFELNNQRCYTGLCVSSSRCCMNACV